jgi:hypothetical protein
VGQPYNPSFTGLDAVMDPPSSGVYGDLSMSHGDPSLYFPNFSSSTLPQPSHSGIVSDHFGMQQLMPTPELRQTPMQSVLQVIPYKQPPNSTQYISTFSSFQQESPSQDQMTCKDTRKRPRSSESVQEQQLSAFRQQVSKSKGVPGFLLGGFCTDTDPAPKRSRTSAQKKNKNDVEKAGGACFLCRMIKKRVIPLALSTEFLLAAANTIGSVLANVLATLADSGGMTLAKNGGRNLAIQLASCGRVMLRQN